MSRADLERRILDAVREELEHDARDNAAFGKEVLDVQLVGEFPDTKLVVAVDERRPPLVHDNPPQAVLLIGNALLTVVAFAGDVTIEEPPRRMYNAAIFLRVRKRRRVTWLAAAMGVASRQKGDGRGALRQVVQVLDPDGNLIEITEEESPGPSADGAPDSLATS